MYVSSWAIIRAHDKGSPSIYANQPSLPLHFRLPMTNIDTDLLSLSGIDQLLQPKITEDVEIVEDQEDTHAIAAYYAADSNLVDDESRFERIFFEPRLGLAVETMADGITIEQLWRVV